MSDSPRQPSADPVGDDALPPAAHPPVRPDEPAPLDEAPVAPLTEPNETKGG